MVPVTALDIQVSLRNPMAMLEDSMTSVNTLYITYGRYFAQAIQPSLQFSNFHCSFYNVPNLKPLRIKCVCQW